MLAAWFLLALVGSTAARPSQLAIPVQGAESTPPPPTSTGGAPSEVAPSTPPPMPEAMLPPSVALTPTPPLPPPAQELLPSPPTQTQNQPSTATAPPPSTAPSAPQLRECALLPNTNARGTPISNMQRDSVADCCTACQQAQGCNVYVFCPKNGGCDDGSGKTYPQGLCTLKTQQLAPGQQPEFFATGPVVPWESGYLPA